MDFWNKTFKKQSFNLEFASKIWRLGTCVLTFLDDMMYHGYNIVQKILIKRKVWGFYSRK